MQSYHLNFITDDDLYHHVQDTVRKYRFKIDFKTLNENLLDPIKLTFDSAIYQGGCDNTALRAILENEILRQLDKTNTNHIGYFHQNIFHYIGQAQGWSVPKQGFDVENQQQHIYVEMKNKHNTMNSSSSAKTYLRMQHKLLQQPQATCMLVEVIAKRSQNVAWQCSVDGQRMQHEQIRRVSIDKFYELVTGEPTAFAQLCAVLPQVLQDVLAQETQQLIENTVFQDIEQHQIQNILHALYLMSFETYQGFDSFKFKGE